MSPHPHRRIAPLAWLTVAFTLVAGIGPRGALDWVPAPRYVAAQTAAATAADVADAMSTPASALIAKATDRAASTDRSDPPTSTAGGFARSVDVADVGWARVPLRPETRARMAPDGRDLRVLDPAGGDVPYVVRSWAPAIPEAEVDLTLTSVEESADGWLLVFDAGRALPLRRFRFEFEGAMAVPDVRLESSADGVQWLQIAEGDLFRVGDAAGLARTTLDVDSPASGGGPARYLRLHWPRAGGLPDVEAATILPIAYRPEEFDVALGLREIDLAPGSASYDIALPGSGLRLDRVEVAWAGAGGIGYRLLRPTGGAWDVLAEGEATRPTSGDALLKVPVPDAPLGAPSLRLEIVAGGTAPARVTSVVGWVRAEWVVFFAPSPGRYRLEFGRLGLAPPPSLRGQPPAEGTPIPEARLGPDEVLPPADLPMARLAVGGALPADVDFAAAWRVASTTESAPLSAGEIVRLVVPEDVYPIARPDLADIRLAHDAGGGAVLKQVPFVRWSLPEPVLVVDAPAQLPTAGTDSRTSRVTVELPSLDLPYTMLELSAPAALFHREVEVFVVAPDPIEGEEVRIPISFADWGCPGAARLPCRITLPWHAVDRPRLRDGRELGPSTPPTDTVKPRIEIVVDNGDDAPLPSIGVKLWRRQDALAFAWPAERGAGDVRLVAGSSEVGAPQYDLEALRDDLVARAVRDVEAKAIAATADDSLSARLRERSDIAFVAALGVAALALLWLLARMLRPSGAGG